MPAFVLEKNGDDLILKNKYGIYSKIELGIQLKDGHLTIEELGNIYHLNMNQMIHVVRTLGIVYRNNLNDTRIYDPHISPSMHQVILGTLLGDAYMRDSKSYSLAHGINQMDYCYHVAEKLHPFIASFGDTNTDCKTKKFFSFWTYHHNIFLQYFQRFYSYGKNKKFLKIDTAMDIEPEGLAYWYMDDGKFNAYGSNLCVGKITKNEADNLISLLKNKFNLNVTFQAQNIKKEHYNLYIKADSRAHFYNLISPYIIKSMNYKLIGGPPPKKTFSKDSIILRHSNLCKKAGRFIRYFGDEDTKNEILKFNKEDSKSIYIKSILDAIENKNQISCPSFRTVPADTELIELFKQGLTDKEIAEKYGLGRNRIGEIRRNYGLNKSNCRFTSHEHNHLTELFSQPGMTLNKARIESRISFYKLKRWFRDYKGNSAL